MPNRTHSPSTSWSLLALLALAPAAAATEDPIAAIEKWQQKLFTDVAPAVVFLSSKTTFGSGFIVSPEGWILTNAHVVQGAGQVDVVLHDGRKLTGQVTERASDQLDLALVKVSLSGAYHLKLKSTLDLSVGNWVASIGHNEGGIWTYNTGMISNIYPSGTGRDIFQTQIPLNPGSSGGPIFNRLGEVVGIVTAGLKNSNSINFGIRLERALTTLEKLSQVVPCLVIRAPQGTPVFVDGRMIGAGPKIVILATEKTYEVMMVVHGNLVKRQVRFPNQRAVDLAQP